MRSEHTHEMYAMQTIQKMKNSWLFRVSDKWLKSDCRAKDFKVTLCPLCKTYIIQKYVNIHDSKSLIQNHASKNSHLQ